jgi:MFS-type transporter involved in bile tolerance (Atg22 family)
VRFYVCAIFYLQLDTGTLLGRCLIDVDGDIINYFMEMSSSQYNALESSSLFHDNNNKNEVTNDAVVSAACHQKQRHNPHNNNLPQKMEATGLALNSIARGLVGMSSLFLGPALLILAQDAAVKEGGGCNDSNNNYNGQDDSSCNDNDNEGRVYGMRPSSLLTNIGVFSGVFSAILLPLFGAIVDHTPHRKAIGQWAAILLSLIKGIEIFISQSTWFFISILQVLNYILYQAHLCAAYAYTAELSTDPNEQTMYNARFQTINYLAMLAFLIVVTVSSSLLNVGDVGQARISQTLAFILCLIVFGIAWGWYFHPRPALRHVPGDSTLLTAGFRKLSKTSSQIVQSWSSLRYFLLSVMLSESATGALSTISTTYMIHVLNMNSSQIGTVFLCVFVAGIPGSKLGGSVGLKINPLRSALLCLIIFIINTSLAALIMTGEESQHVMYLFAAVWGVCLGWLHPTNAALYCTIIPRGQESELMGLYLFSGLVFSWLPPFLFTLLNEVGASMRIGLASLNLFFAGGFIFLKKIGDYQDAVDFALSRGSCGGDDDDDNDAKRLSLPELT